MASLKQIPGDLDITIAIGDKLEPVEFEFDIDISGYTFSAEITVAATATVIPMTVDESQKASRKISVSCLSAVVPKGRQAWALKWAAGAATARTIISGDYVVQ